MLVLIGDDFNEMLDMHTQKINVLYLNEQLIVRIFDLQESVGIRLNQEPPNIYFKLKKVEDVITKLLQRTLSFLIRGFYQTFSRPFKNFIFSWLGKKSLLKISSIE